MHTKRGTVAGVPLADLVYNAAMARILHSLRERLSAAGLVFEATAKCDIAEVRPLASPIPTPMKIHEVSYVDDMAMPIFSDASSVLVKLAHATSICIDVFHRFGLELNFGNGKSEALIQWRGQGSETARRSVSVEFEDSIKCDQHVACPVHLRIVRVYDHLGPKTMLGNKMQE